LLNQLTKIISNLDPKETTELRLVLSKANEEVNYMKNVILLYRRPVLDLEDNFSNELLDVIEFYNDKLRSIILAKTFPKELTKAVNLACLSFVNPNHFKVPDNNN